MAEETTPYDPQGTDTDDWFDLEKYKQAAQVAYDFSLGKMGKEGEEQRKGIQTTGEEARSTESNRASEQRETIGKEALETRARDALLQQYKDREEARDRGQALQGYRF